MTQPLDREIDELIHTAFDDPGYVDVHWTLESIVTDLQSEDKTFYQIFRLDVLLAEFITYLEDWESETGVDQIVNDIRDYTYDVHTEGGGDPEMPEICGQTVYKVSHLLVHLGYVDFDWGVPPSCSPSQLLLSNYHQHKQNWAESGTHKIQVNPTQVNKQMGLHVDIFSDMRISKNKISFFAVKCAWTPPRDSIDVIVDDIVEYATWNETETGIITAVSNITGRSNGILHRN